MDFTSDRDIYKYIGGRYLTLRVQSGLRQEDVANVAGISRLTVGRIEKGLATYDAVSIIKLKQAYGEEWELKYD